MNKQEIIEKFENNNSCFPQVGEKNWVELNYAIGLVEELDGPTKVKVPPFMEDFLDFCFENEEDGITAYNGLFNICSSWPKDEILKWSFENPYKFINTFQYGYIVEEPLYIVPVPNLSKEFFYTVDRGHVSFCQRKNIIDVKSQVKFTFEEVERLFPDLIDTIEEVEK